MHEFSRNFQQLLNRLDQASGDILSEIKQLREALKDADISVNAQVTLNALEVKARRLDALIPASFELVE